jgi:acetylornithine deacetylase
LSGAILEHLAALVACDTQNPPRQISLHHRLYNYLADACGSGFHVEHNDHGDGRVSWLARRGSPGVLFNVHLDTVPAGEGWSSDPLRLVVGNGRATGLGACDIKGAAACLLTLAQQSDVDLGLLFTSDEEGSDPCCVLRFVEAQRDVPALTVVAEPTGGRAVLGHRGYLSVHGTFQGCAGHTSMPKQQRRSALHQLVEWSAAALNRVAVVEAVAGSGVDFCFNLGTIDGGVKNNLVAERAEVRWSIRLPPGHDVGSVRRELIELAAGRQASWETTFEGPAAPSTIQLREQARQYLAPLALPTGSDVDFWTEAALFSQAGWPAVVLGPGDIAQAHTANEWVALDQLQSTYDLYSKIAHADQHA